MALFSPHRPQQAETQLEKASLYRLNPDQKKDCRAMVRPALLPCRLPGARNLAWAVPAVAKELGTGMALAAVWTGLGQGRPKTAADAVPIRMLVVGYLPTQEPEAPDQARTVNLRCPGHRLVAAARVS